MDFFDKNLHNSFYPIDKDIHPKSFFPDYKSSILRSPKKKFGINRHDNK